MNEVNLVQVLITEIKKGLQGTGFTLVENSISIIEGGKKLLKNRFPKLTKITFNGKGIVVTKMPGVINPAFLFYYYICI